MERTKNVIYTQILVGILIFTAFLIPKVHLTLAQRAASVIPTNIRAYNLVELDGAALRAEVELGQTITLPLDNRQFEVQLVPNNLLAAEYAAQLEPTLQDTGTFKGTVVGDPYSIVRLSLREGLVRGYILTGSGDWYFIEPVRHYGDPTELGVPWNLHFTYKTTDVEFRPYNPNDMLRPPPPSQLPETHENLPSTSVLDSSGLGSSISFIQPVQTVQAEGEGKEVRWLPFERLVNNKWEDLSEYHKDGINHNAIVVPGAPQIGGNAAYLAYYSYPGDPGPDWIDLGNDDSIRLDKQDFTIAFWLKFADYGWNNPNSACIFFNAGGWDGNDWNQMIWLGVIKQNGQNKIKLGFYGPNCVFDYNLPFVTFTHIAITFQKNNTDAKLYINGDHYQTKDMGGYPDYWDWNGCELGRHYKGAYGGAYWEGRLDEVHIYKRVLSESEVAALTSAATYSGYVRDYAGEPIEDVKVECVEIGDYDYTNANGYYSFSTLPGTGEFTLRASKSPSYAFVTTEKQVSAAGGSHEVNFKLAWVVKLILGYDPAFYDLFNDEILAKQAQLDIINMAEGIFSSANNKINMTFNVVRHENITQCTQTKGTWLLGNFTNAIYYWGVRDVAQLFTGSIMDDGWVGAAYQNTSAGTARYATSYIQYQDFTDAERARMSVHEMAHNFNASHEEGVIWYEQGDYYVSLMHYIEPGQYATNYFSDGTKRMFTTVIGSGNNTKWILIAASRDFPDY